MSTVKYIFTCKTCEQNLSYLQKFYWLKACRENGLYDKSAIALDGKLFDELEKLDYIITTEYDSPHFIMYKPKHRIESENAIFFCSNPKEHTQHNMSNYNYD